MAKDPAFLWYPGDWLGGTMTFSRSHKGAYMDLLMAQFNNGHMTLQDIQTILGKSDYETMWDDKLKHKFKVDENGKFYNEKLDYEVVRRKNYTNSRKKNLKKDEHMAEHKASHMRELMADHMENGNGNGNINANKKIVCEKFSEDLTEAIFSDGSTQKLGKDQIALAKMGGIKPRDIVKGSIY